MKEAVIASIILWAQSQLFIIFWCVFVCLCACVGRGGTCIFVADIAPAVFYVIGDLQLYCIFLSPC